MKIEIRNIFLFFIADVYDSKKKKNVPSPDQLVRSKVLIGDGAKIDGEKKKYSFLCFYILYILRFEA